MVFDEFVADNINFGATIEICMGLGIVFDRDRT